MVDILSRIAVCERASIDECYLDLTEEAHTRLAACSGQPTLPVNPDRVHVCGQVRLLSNSPCILAVWGGALYGQPRQSVLLKLVVVLMHNRYLSPSCCVWHVVNVLLKAGLD